MKKLLLSSIVFCSTLIAAVLFNTSSLFAQTVFQTQAVDIRMTGTSTLHDWEMKAASGNTEAAFVIDASNKILSLTKLSFTLPAKNLKSEHTMMDNNTYKALNVKQHPNISFVLTTATVTPVAGNEYRLNCIGKLTIAGTTRETDIVATARFNPADRSFTITGVKKMKMTDFNVKPPTVMLGTIKTGNDIAISYNVRFTR